MADILSSVMPFISSPIRIAPSSVPNTEPFPPRKLTLLRAWVVLHREELEADWKLLSEGLDAFKIDPLR